MSLTKYKEKRDFKKTPEPGTGEKEKKSKFSFVVQRHDATRLHYDFRLEMEGVLKSWAVPKGPSMVAGEKRLAVMVEDHPYDYRNFYGEIPEGNYGAGVVEIWDNGTYKPMKPSDNPEKDLMAQLYKGDLKFILNGAHLKGAFALVRINDEEGKNWLLIKKKDEFAERVYDIEKIPPLKSKHIRKKKKTPKQNTKMVKEERSTVADKKVEEFPSEKIKPMLAKLSDQVIDYPDWIYETKFDGYRCISKVDERQVEMLTRNSIVVTGTYSSIADELKKIEDDVILDGELIVENSEGINDFQALQNYSTTRQGRLKYYVFDMLYLNGHKITDLPLLQRKELLNEFFKGYKFENIINTEYQEGQGKLLFEKLAKKGYEGVIAKAPGSIYQPGKRTDKWLKVKNVTMQEAIICGYTLPQNTRQYFGSLILGLYENKKLRYIGNVGTGFTEVSLSELHEKMERIRTNVNPFDPPQKLVGAKGKPVWIRPELVCNIKYMEWTSDGHLRHPVFMGLRIDKKAEEVILEKTVAKESDSNSARIKEKVNQKTSENEFSLKKDPGNEKTLKISGKELKLTNLNKVYWPEEGYTKGDLINYYQSVSKYILPYLKNRPQSLNRHPNGITGKSFYQKDMDVEQIPDWVRTERVYSKSNEDYIDYLICNDPATLVYMANLGCIELNPWHSTFMNQDNPTWLMLDLDPGDTPFKDVIDTAIVIKEILDEISVPGYCKTSGATGLHIYIALGEKFNYDEAKTFAEILAVIAHNRIPGITSIERVVKKRNEKVYIDFLQNRKGQTIAAPYSVRPQKMATVSAPLKWEEVTDQLTPQMFTIKNMVQRLEKIGDLWTPLLKKGIDLGKALKAVEKL
jgi:bifunctional non-homologous end joining protein LigD